MILLGTLSTLISQWPERNRSVKVALKLSSTQHIIYCLFYRQYKLLQSTYEKNNNAREPSLKCFNEFLPYEMEVDMQRS